MDRTPIIWRGEADVLSPEEIAQQQELLAAYRRTLNIYLKQKAEIGGAYSPPGLISGINDSREHIKRIKATLRAAGVVVKDGANDSPTETLSMLTIEPNTASSHPSAATTRSTSVPAWLLVSVVVIAMASFGAYWWYNNRAIGATGPTEASAQATAEGAASAEGPPTDAAPAAEPDVAAIESQLADACISLSETQADLVRGYISDSSTGYKALANRVLPIVGDLKFRQTLYYDEIYVRYTEVVGEDHFYDFDADQLKAGMLRAWNEHYTNQRVDSFDEIVEPRS
jgi:hypothetical protein